MGQFAALAAAAETKGMPALVCCPDATGINADGGWLTHAGATEAEPT
ncbi:hypothetical protein [Erwinia sp. E_sp_W01_6]